MMVEEEDNEKLGSKRANKMKIYECGGGWEGKGLKNYTKTGHR